MNELVKKPGMVSSLITCSRLKCFNRCKRLHRYQYELGYRSVHTPLSLAFGTVLHAGLEAWWGWWEAHQGKTQAQQSLESGVMRTTLAASQEAMLAKSRECEEMDQATMVKAEVLMIGYDARWSAEMPKYRVLGVEVQFRTRLRNPATGYPTKDLETAGKLDAILERIEDKTVWIVEHKTSSEDLTLGSPYWQRLRMDPQISIYYDGAEALGHQVAGCIYDVLAKPGERLKLATPEDKRKYKKDGTLYANQRDRDETIEEFRNRLLLNMAENPEAYFGRAEVVRTADELKESQADTHATALAMREGERLERHPRNPDACFLYHRECSFYPVCSLTDSLDNAELYHRLENVHPELSNDD
jgi:hypothetical protein